MPTASFFDREARLAVHLVSLFQPLPADFIARHADDLSWPGLALNEQLPWSAALVTAHRARLDPQRLANNPSPAARAAMLAALGPSAPPPPCPAPAPAAATIGDVLWPWAHDCTLAPDRPLASLTLDEAVANLRHLAWARLCESPSSPWTPAWSRTLAPRFEEPHPNVSNVALSALRRVHDDECAPALGAAPLAFLAAFFAREPRYMCCSVAISDAHGVLPTVEVDPRAFERGARRVAAAVTRFAQGPRRPVPLGPVQPLTTGACVVLDRAWQAIFSACALPTHSFHELAVPPSKQLAGEPVVLRFAEVFAEGATLPAAHDCLIVRRAAKEPTFFPDQLVLSPRLVAQLRACGAPNLTFTPAAGSNSNMVTTGPGWISVTRPSMPKSASLVVSNVAWCVRSAAVTRSSGCCGSSSRLSGGSGSSGAGPVGRSSSSGRGRVEVFFLMTGGGGGAGAIAIGPSSSSSPSSASATADSTGTAFPFACARGEPSTASATACRPCSSSGKSSCWSFCGRRTPRSPWSRLFPLTPMSCSPRR